MVETQAFILSKIKYKDKVFIVKFFTKSQGILPGIVRESRKQQASFVLSPFNFVNIAYLMQENKEVQSIKYIERNSKNINLFHHPLKYCLSSFIAEMLLLTVKESERNIELFHFLLEQYNSIEQDKNLQNIPLKFMIEFSSFLGIDVCSSEMDYSFTKKFKEVYFPIILALKRDEHVRFKSKTDREDCMDQLFAFYDQQLEGFKPPKSVGVIKDLFS